MTSYMTDHIIIKFYDIIFIIYTAIYIWNLNI